MPSSSTGSRRIFRSTEPTLKNAALHGTIVVNNPFSWTADDKFFNYALAHKMGVAIPPTVVLPHNKHPEGTTDRSMRNLIYPAELGRVV